MSLQVIEGTWEEIERRRSELQGKRLRLEILEDVDSPISGRQKPTLFDRLEGKIGQLSFDPTDVSERSEEYFGRIMNEQQKNDNHAEDAM